MLSDKFISIRTKFVLSITVVIVFFGGLSLFVADEVISLSRTEMIKKAGLVGNILANQLVDMVLTNNAASISGLIYTMKHEDLEILYIAVFDKNKDIIGHTFEDNRIPVFLSTFPGDTGIRFFVDGKNRISILQKSEGLLNGTLGTVVVGIDESLMAKRWNRILVLLAIVFALLLIYVAAAAGFMSYFVIRPINHIIRQLESFVPGHQVPEFRLPFNDEIRLLGKKFREMTERLNALISEYRQTQHHMIETEKLASIGTLASGVAHEINNPIAGIEICAHRLQKQGTLDNKQEEYVKLITEAAKHIQTIVKSLLTYARRPDQKVELVDLCLVTKFALKLLNYRLQKKAIVIKENLPECSCNVWGIRAQLVQVIINGVINSIDASNPMGVISVSIAVENNYFAIEIADNGSGVDQSIIGKVFDPFFSTKGSQGTGLGLYVSYNIVKTHKGTITLSPIEEGGALLKVLLPKAGDEKLTIEPLPS